jgi:carboxyl-terminal processing protease
MNRRFQFAVVASSTMLVVLLLFGAVHGRSAPPADDPYGHLRVYTEVLSHISTDYVEDPDMKAVTAGAINGMLESIDPFASYLNADQYKQYQKEKGSAKGDVGLTLARRLGYLSVEDALPGSAAAKAGLATGDVIETINNVSTRDMPLAFADLLLQGAPGSSLEMSVLTPRQADAQKLTLVRAPLVYPAVTGQLVTDKGPEPIGLITTSTLQSGRVKEISQKISELQKQGAKRLMLDLRSVTIGPTEEGIALANLFIDKGLLGYTQGQKYTRQDYQASSSKAVTKLPLVVLTNRGTAGAAEIAVAALLDSKRAEVVGELRTYGDAAIRKAVTLDDGSAVILSVAKYYSPSGKAIQDNGVTPSVVQADVEIAPVDDDQGQAPVAPTPKPGDDPILKKGYEVISAPQK